MQSLINILLRLHKLENKRWHGIFIHVVWQNVDRIKFSKNQTSRAEEISHIRSEQRYISKILISLVTYMIIGGWAWIEVNTTTQILIGKGQICCDSLSSCPLTGDILHSLLSILGNADAVMFALILSSERWWNACELLSQSHEILSLCVDNPWRMGVCNNWLLLFLPSSQSNPRNRRANWHWRRCRRCNPACELNVNRCWSSTLKKDVDYWNAPSLNPDENDLH